MKIFLGVDLNEVTDEQMLALVHALRSQPKQSKRTKEIADAATDLAGALEERAKMSTSERARRAAEARWGKSKGKSVSKANPPAAAPEHDVVRMAKEVSALARFHPADGGEAEEMTFDGRDILEGTYPGGPNDPALTGDKEADLES